jgi:hypothetical protein
VPLNPRDTSGEGGQGQDDEAEKGGTRESTGQGVKEGACWLGHGLMDLLELAASGTSLARHKTAAFAVK